MVVVSSFERLLRSKLGIGGNEEGLRYKDGSKVLFDGSEGEGEGGPPECEAEPGRDESTAGKPLARSNESSRVVMVTQTLKT